MGDYDFEDSFVNDASEFTQAVAGEQRESLVASKKKKNSIVAIQNFSPSSNFILRCVDRERHARHLPAVGAQSCRWRALQADEPA